MKKVWKILSYLAVAVLASFATLLLYGGNENTQYSKLDELADLIEARYIGEADRTAMEDAAADAMIGAIGDRWSYYIPAAEYQSYIDNVNNSYVGIGVTIQLDQSGTGFSITKVNEGGSAEEAGLQVGDIMVSVDGADVRNLTSSELGALVKGEEGTFVEIGILRGEDSMVLTVERRHVDVPVATYEMLDQNIGLVTIENFHSGCAKQTIAAIEAVREQGAKALVLDVRNNGGGYASELVDLLDYLLPEGILFRTVNYKGEETVDRSDAAYLDMPMAVMVNGNSYSAAEFFAVALSEYEAAVVVGEKTVGKGYYQVNHVLSDGSAVNLSIGEYFTPKGNNLAGVGITPDIEVSVDEETANAIYAGTMPSAKDPQIRAAMEALTEQIS